MTDISEFVKRAKLACNSCDFEAENTGSAMVHALTIGHVVSGETPDGHQVEISIERE
jgi:hypothetical protein